MNEKTMGSREEKGVVGIEETQRNTEAQRPLQGHSATKETETSSASLYRPLSVLFQKNEGLKEMEAALYGAIDEFNQNPAVAKPDASAFLLALEKCPHLVVSESDPALFLETENGDPVAASRRLLKYWTWRREVLGSDFAYKSVMSGDALGEKGETSKRLLQGIFWVLTSDAEGRTVFCLESERRRFIDSARECDIPKRMRLIFYSLSLLATNPKSQSEGAVMLFVVSGKSATRFPNAELVVRLIVEAMPMRVHSRHIACCPPPGAKRIFTTQIIPSIDHQFTSRGKYAQSQKHIGSSPADLCQKLLKCGFLKENLPASVGGTYQYERFEKYIVEQLSRAARALQQTGSETDRMGVVQEDNVREPEGTQDSKLPGKAPLSKQLEAEKSIVGSISEERPQVESLQGMTSGRPVFQSRDLLMQRGHGAAPRLPITDANSKPKAASRREMSKASKPYRQQEQQAWKKKVPLKGVKLAPCGVEVVDRYQGEFSEESVRKLAAAMETVPTKCFERGKTEEEIAEYIRKRNAIYSKRKYYKRKLKLESLVNSKDSLETQNKRLKAENERLENLYMRARNEAAAQETLDLLTAARRTEAATALANGAGGALAGDIAASSTAFLHPPLNGGTTRDIALGMRAPPSPHRLSGFANGFSSMAPTLQDSRHHDSTHHSRQAVRVGVGSSLSDLSTLNNQDTVLRELLHGRGGVLSQHPFSRPQRGSQFTNATQQSQELQELLILEQLQRARQAPISSHELAIASHRLPSHDPTRRLTANELLLPPFGPPQSSQPQIQQSEISPLVSTTRRLSTLGSGEVSNGLGLPLTSQDALLALADTRAQEAALMRLLEIEREREGLRNHLLGRR